MESQGTDKYSKKRQRKIEQEGPGSDGGLREEVALCFW